MKKYFYLKDHPARAGQVLGNIRVTVDESGEVRGYNDYGESHHFRGYPFGLRMRSMNNALSTDMYKYSSKELDEEGLAGYAPFSVRMISKGFLDGNAAAVYVNDSYISGSGLYARGYTIVVVDENGTVVDKAHFDTYSSTAEADAMADFINNIPEGQYVIGVIKDDVSQSMTEAAHNALSSVGCQHSREVGFRYSYAFVGKKGANSCGYEAYAPAGQGFVDKRIGESQPLALYYFGARYYDPMIGRWLSVDPLAEKYQSFSPYNFVLNNPINTFDPNGKFPALLLPALPYIVAGAEALATAAVSIWASVEVTNIITGGKLYSDKLNNKTTTTTTSNTLEQSGSNSNVSQMSMSPDNAKVKVTDKNSKAREKIKYNKSLKKQPPPNLPGDDNSKDPFVLHPPSGSTKGGKTIWGLLNLFSLYKDDADRTKEEKQNIEKIKNIKDDSNDKKQYIIQGE